MRIGFRFRWIPLLACMAAVALGLALGQWQTGRAEQKERIALMLAERAAAPALTLPAAAPLEAIEYRRVLLKGEFVRDWPLYLDNRPRNGIAGFYLLMPMKLAGSDRHVLVMRGWLPRDGTERSRLPQLATPAGPVEITGSVRRDAGHLLELGTPASLRPNAIRQNVEIGELERASGLALLPLVVEQASDTGDGLARDWPAPSGGAEKHRAYAFQWYGLAGTAFLFYIFTGFRRGPD